MNPAVTLTFLFLNKISRADAVWYVIAQCIGGTVAMLLVKSLFPAFVAAPAVNYVQTQTGMWGILIAFIC
jgi:aquaporin Z